MYKELILNFQNYLDFDLNTDTTKENYGDCYVKFVIF